MKKVKFFNASERMKSVAKISSGTMLGQLISIITLPFYTRIFGAAIMGDWALVTSVATIVNTFSDLGLSNAIMIEEDEEDTKKLFSIITTVVLFFSAIVGIFYGFFYTLFPSETSIKGSFYALFVFFQIFTQQQIQLSYSWLNRKKQYNVLMKNPLINNLSAAIVAIPLGLLGFKTYGYYIGLIIGQIVTIIHMRRKLPKVFLNFNFAEYKRLITKHIDFCKFQIPTNMTAQIKNQLPVILIRTLFGNEMVGYYSISQKVLNIPISLLANAIGRVYYQTIAEMNRLGQEIGEYTLRNMNRAMKLAIIPMIGLLSVSDLVCSIVFGNDYLIAGNITRIVSFNTFFMFLLMSTQGIAIVLRKQKYNLVSAVFQAFGYIFGLGIGKVLFSNIYIGCLFMTLTFCMAQIVYFVFIFKSIKIAPKKYLQSIITYISIILVGTFIVRLFTNFIGLTSGI